VIVMINSSPLYMLQPIEKLRQCYVLKVLSDEGKRKQYDTFGMAGDNFAGQGPFGGRGGASKFDDLL
jgi:DnaJ-class molecular chaperone